MGEGAKAMTEEIKEQETEQEIETSEAVCMFCVDYVLLTLLLLATI